MSESERESIIVEVSRRKWGDFTPWAAAGLQGKLAMQPSVCPVLCPYPDPPNQPSFHSQNPHEFAVPSTHVLKWNSNPPNNVKYSFSKYFYFPYGSFLPIQFA